MSCRSIRELLDAHVDGELTPGQSAVVAEHLSSCAGCAGEYEDVLETVRMLRSRLSPERAPDTLRRRVRAAVRREAETGRGTSRLVELPGRGRGGWWRLAAAAVVLSAASAGTTYLAVNRRAASVDLSGEVLSSHLRALMPGHLTDVASNDQHNVKPWFDGRVDVAPEVPRLEDQGFPLIGGRVDYVAGRGVPVVIYGRRKHVISFYSWPAEGAPDRPVVHDTRHGYHLLYWRSLGLEHWLVSDLGTGELEQLAELLQHPPPITR